MNLHKPFITAIVLFMLASLYLLTLTASALAGETITPLKDKININPNRFITNGTNNTNNESQFFFIRVICDSETEQTPFWRTIPTAVRLTKS